MIPAIATKATVVWRNHERRETKTKSLSFYSIVLSVRLPFLRLATVHVVCISPVRRY